MCITDMKHHDVHGAPALHAGGTAMPSSAFPSRPAALPLVQCCPGAIHAAAQSRHPAMYRTETNAMRASGHATGAAGCATSEAAVAAVLLLPLPLPPALLPRRLHRHLPRVVVAPRRLCHRCRPVLRWPCHVQKRPAHIRTRPYGSRVGGGGVLGMRCWWVGVAKRGGRWLDYHRLEAVVRVDRQARRGHQR